MQGEQDESARDGADITLDPEAEKQVHTHLLPSRGNPDGTLSFVVPTVVSAEPLKDEAMCPQPALGTDGKPVWMQRLLGLDPSRDGGASGGSSDEEGQVLHYERKAVAACQLS